MFISPKKVKQLQKKGWDYLNSKGDSDDSYHDSDGSWGYKNSDGSASFHGNDGSWGYREADGSVSYYDSDGSWGYRNSDGSGSYYGSSGDTKYYDAWSDDHDDEEVLHGESRTDNFGHSLGEALGTIIGMSVATSMALEAKREAERREQARIRSSRRRAWLQKHRKGIMIAFLSVIIALFGTLVYYEYQLLTPIGYSSDNLMGLDYTEVIQLLKESGFSYVRTKEISDLSLSRENEANLVSEVKLIHTTSFKESTVYPSNLWITVMYHTVKLYAPPVTAKEAKGMNYLDVIEAFENAGFTNVNIQAEYDIILGWLADDGEVKSVTINNEKKFDSYDKYRLDAEVNITYHTIRKNKPD